MTLKSEMESALGEVKQKNVTDLADIGEIFAPLSVSQAFTPVFLHSIYTSFIASCMIKSMKETANLTRLGSKRKKMFHNQNPEKYVSCK